MTVAAPLPYNELVAQALSTHSHIPLDQLVVLDNSAKYGPEDGGHAEADANDQNLLGVFSTMANMNHFALETEGICAGEKGPSFRDTILQAADQLAALAQGRPIRYVELGPEPWKSKVILTRLLQDHANVMQYVGVDINPKSEETMRQAIAPIIGDDRFSYVIRNYYDCLAEDFPTPKRANVVPDNCVTIVTNLGFQEGNDLPSRMQSMLRQLTYPGDLILSEMQLFQNTDAATIKGFYDHPEMRQFSTIQGQKFDSSCSNQLSAAGAPFEADGAEYLIKLVPLETEVGPVNVATTLISGSVNGDKKYMVTNSCLKYTSKQYRRAREVSGAFAVKRSFETGDQSVVFQISERK
ncbi:MAG: hypothetical protein Q9162_002387 [Coniocarpon cinnabarinum]